MNYLNLKFPENSKFLVTGGAGFIGSNLVEAILKMGYKVRVLDDFSTGKRENIEMHFSNPYFELIEGSITDLEICKKATENVDYVLNQAAWGSVPRSIKMPVTYEEINIKGTVNMMEASKLNGVKRFVYASSSSVYGDHPALPKKEGVEGNILSPYALTKKVNEDYGKLYYRLYGLETIGMRYFNVFGRRQDPYGVYAAVIPKFVKAIMDEDAPTINGDGQHSRDFTYIDNVIEFNLKACLAPKEACGEAFNVAFGGRVTVETLYNEIANLLGSDLKAIYGPDREGDIKHSNADITKGKTLVGYDPQYSYEDGIKLAIEWYKDNLKNNG